MNSKTSKKRLQITLYWQNAGLNSELKTLTFFAAAIFPFTVFL